MQKIETFTNEKNRFLSNFYPYMKDKKFETDLEIIFEGITFDCVENAYQAAKTDDVELKKKISKMNPYDVVEMVKAGEVPTKENWNDIKLDIMYSLVWQKFQNIELKQKLIDTKDLALEEGNTWGDVFWGICDGAGENHLGKILMKVRGNLKA